MSHHDFVTAATDVLVLTSDVQLRHTSFLSLAGIRSLRSMRGPALDSSLNWAAAVLVPAATFAWACPVPCRLSVWLVGLFLLPPSSVCLVFILTLLSSMLWLSILLVLPWSALCLVSILCWLISRSRGHSLVRSTPIAGHTH